MSGAGRRWGRGVWRAAALASEAVLPLLLPRTADAQLLQGQGDDRVPVTVDADNGIEWIRDAKTYIARGNARAIRGDTTVTADMLTARYREKPDGTTEIHVLQADGNVVIETPRERATGERAVYSLDEGSIIRSAEHTSELHSLMRISYAG